MVEVVCSRCDRHEYNEATAAGAGLAPSTLIIRFAAGSAPAIELSFDDLCGPCQKTVGGHIEAIAKKLTNVSPNRGKKEAPGVLVETNEVKVGLGKEVVVTPPPLLPSAQGAQGNTPVRVVAVPAPKRS